MPLTLDEKALVIDVVKPLGTLPDEELENIYTRFQEHFAGKTGVRYTTRTRETALGTEHEFLGPGMPQYANSVHFLQPLNDWAKRCCDEECKDGTSRADYEADTVRSLLASAFQAGYLACKREFKAWLG